MNDDQILQRGGDEHDIKEYSKSNGADLEEKDTKLTIVNAAIRHNGKIFIGFRHALIMEKVWEEFPAEHINQEEQGFLTSDGDFVSRVEAANIAFKAGQIPNGIYSLDSYQIFKL